MGHLGARERRTRACVRARGERGRMEAGDGGHKEGRAEEKEGVGYRCHSYVRCAWPRDWSRSFSFADIERPLYCKLTC